MKYDDVFVLWLIAVYEWVGGDGLLCYLFGTRFVSSATLTTGTFNDLTIDLIMANNNNMITFLISYYH